MANETEQEAVAAEEQFIDCQCPHCGHTLSFPGNSVGRVEECFNCMEPLIVPADGSTAGRRLPLPLETPTLILRRLAPDDLLDLAEVDTDPESSEEIEGGPHEENVSRWIREDAKAKFTQPNQPLWLGLVRRDTKKLVGYLSLTFIDAERRQAALSHVAVNPRFRRKGHATEAMRAALVFCFAGIGLHRVVASCGSHEAAARGLIEKAGFRLEGEWFEDRQEHGKWVDTLLFAMLEREYAAANNSAA